MHVHVLVRRLRGQLSDAAKDSTLKAFHHQTTGKVADFIGALTIALKRVCEELHTAPRISNEAGFNEYDTWLQNCKRLRDSRSQRQLFVCQ
jgi:hypothetical protein